MENGQPCQVVLSAEAQRELVSAARMCDVVTIIMRTRLEVNTDPQRRCYNGAHFSSELRWTPREALEYVHPDKVEARLKFWRELNDYAVSQRGQGARSEFKVDTNWPV